MSEKLDYKKAFPDLYAPKQAPALVEVPPMTFIMVDGKGDPNEEGGSYQQAVGLLYGLTFAIKMSRKSGDAPEGYFEYVVPPLEGLWWSEDDLWRGESAPDKSRFCWTSMIRQPEFVTPQVFEWAKGALAKKKPELDLSRARLETFCEGFCVQAMHVGPYDAEPETLARMQRFALDSGCREELENGRRHHELYLGDPRRTAPQRLRTVLRHPVKRAGLSS